MKTNAKSKKLKLKKLSLSSLNPKEAKSIVGGLRPSVIGGGGSDESSDWSCYYTCEC